MNAIIISPIIKVKLNFVKIFIVKLLKDKKVRFESNTILERYYFFIYSDGFYFYEQKYIY